MADSQANRVEAPRSGGRLRISPLRLIRATTLAAAVAVAGTAALFGIASASGLVDEHVALPSLIGSGALSLASVAAAAAVAVICASMVLAVLAATARRPVRTFRLVATVLAAVSLLMPATISGAPVPMRVVLAGMHVVVWAVCFWPLPWLARR